MLKYSIPFKENERALMTRWHQTVSDYNFLWQHREPLHFVDWLISFGWISENKQYIISNVLIGKQYFFNYRHFILYGWSNLYVKMLWWSCDCSWCTPSQFPHGRRNVSSIVLWMVVCFYFPSIFYFWCFFNFNPFLFHILLSFTLNNPLVTTNSQ